MLASQVVLEQMVRMGRQWSEAIAGFTEEIPGDPGRPAEPRAEWLQRLGWLEIGAEKRVRVTPLGSAVLAHLEQADLEAEIPVSIVLDEGDQLATARVIAQIADAGSCALVDPYFTMDSLPAILYSTQVEAVLTSTKGPKGRMAGLRTALEALRVERTFEVRTTDAFHDRFVVPTHGGPIWMIGTSLNGLGKRLSVMVELKDAESVRRQFREEWNSAEPVQIGDAADAVIDTTPASPDSDSDGTDESMTEEPRAPSAENPPQVAARRQRRKIPKKNSPRGPKGEASDNRKE